MTAKKKMNKSERKIRSDVKKDMQKKRFSSTGQAKAEQEEVYRGSQGGMER